MNSYIHAAVIFCIIIVYGIDFFTPEI
jgi:hypothetical protein